MPTVQWGLAIGPRAQRFLDKMPPGKLRAQVTKRARNLINNPYPHDKVSIKGLPKGHETVWRVRQGDYRILYMVHGTTVLVFDIDDRKDVY